MSVNSQDVTIATTAGWHVNIIVFKKKFKKGFGYEKNFKSITEQA